MTLQSICVFCGSSKGNEPQFEHQAKQLGTLIAREGRRLVFGGGHVGLMGAVADAALAAGGEVVGIIPQSLADKEVAHTRLTRLHVVASMHERKALMAEYSDGFIALPGGMGTLEELFETLTWAQLGLHGKPCGLLNVDGFYRTLLTFLNELVDREFLRPEYRRLLLDHHHADGLLALMDNHTPTVRPKWIDDGQQ
ncbi:MAG: TIGR00730 family Rossman fold protein [Ectothiorhodospiraceae bacterium]|jgi:uncharacterized protein (TIGR00730 family)